MRSAPDSTPTCAPDSFGASGIALDSGGVLAIGIGAATDFFCAAKAAEGASPRTVEWYRMILIRAVRRFGDPRPVDAITAAELRAWLLELRGSLAPESIAGYVRGLKAFGNRCAAEELAAAAGFRGLRRPKVPHRLIARFSDPELRSLQIGYVRCGKPAGQVCNDVPTGAQKFIYACNDQSEGVFFDATSWAGNPVLGRRYRFRVQFNELGTGKWDYSIMDLVTGTTKRKSITSTWHNADGVWYGGENTDEGSVMASAHVGGNDIEMYWMQYLRSSVGTWRVVTDISATSNPPDFVECQIVGNVCVEGAEPSWYGFNIFSQNYTNDGIHIWSSDHP